MRAKGGGGRGEGKGEEGGEDGESGVMVRRARPPLPPGRGGGRVEAGREGRGRGEGGVEGGGLTLPRWWGPQKPSQDILNIRL